MGANCRIQLARCLATLQSAAPGRLRRDSVVPGPVTAGFLFAAGFRLQPQATLVACGSLLGYVSIFSLTLNGRSPALRAQRSLEQMSSASGQRYSQIWPE
jgi:hypothetical protein